MWSRLIVLLARIDLPPLQPIGVIHVNSLPRSIKIKSPRAALAMSVAGLLHSAKRQMNLRSDRRCVDISNPRLQIAHRLERQVDVAGIQRRRKPILNTIGKTNRLIEVVAFNDTHDRSKHFFPGNTHLRAHPAEHRGTKEKSLVQSFPPASPGQQTSPFLG